MRTGTTRPGMNRHAGRTIGMRCATRSAAAIAAVVGALAAASGAMAGGSPEHAVLIIDPTNPESMYIGNYYRQARNIPESNVLYLRSGAANYQEFVANQLAAFKSTLDHRSIADHASYAIVSPTDTFYVAAPGLISDDCFPVGRMSISGAYTTGFISAQVLAGTTVTLPNNYSSFTDVATAFDSSQSYLGGNVSTSGSARRYYLGAMLGYTGPAGNTVAEVLAMIDRSVGADGGRPSGTFYLMNNPADPPRNVRQPFFPSVVTSITSRGGSAQQPTGVLPSGQSNILGISAGFADANIPGAGMTLLAGSFADHLTSYAATFDLNQQTKCSEWIRAGASGTAGAVEEPCNYTGKFPHPRFFVYYYQGLSLGESYLRSMQYVPFQSLLVGDPLTRPFAYIPTVLVENAPVGAVSGVVTLTPTAIGLAPGAAIAGYDLLVDGVKVQSIGAGGSFTLDTTTLGDGHHALRVLVRDSTAMRNVGRWVGPLTTNNSGRSATIGAGTTTGDLGTAFAFNVSATGGAGGAGVREIRLLQNGRVLAATTASSGTLTVHGQNLGAGPSRVQAEAEFTDGRVARSVPLNINVSFSGGGGGASPVAFGYRKDLREAGTHVVELPASFAAAPGQATYTLLSNPAQATVSAAATGPYRLITPNGGATGSETITFRVQTPQGTSNTATITLVYTGGCPADYDNNGLIQPSDVAAFVTAWFTSVQNGTLIGDFDANGSVEPADVAAFVTAWFAAVSGGGC